MNNTKSKEALHHNLHRGIFCQMRHPSKSKGTLFGIERGKQQGALNGEDQTPAAWKLLSHTHLRRPGRLKIYERTEIRGTYERALITGVVGFPDKVALLSRMALNASMGKYSGAQLEAVNSTMLLAQAPTHRPENTESRMQRKDVAILFCPSENIHGIRLYCCPKLLRQGPLLQEPHSRQMTEKLADSRMTLCERYTQIEMVVLISLIWRKMGSLTQPSSYFHLQFQQVSRKQPAPFVPEWHRPLRNSSTLHQST